MTLFDLTPAPLPAWLAVGALLGLIFGSFITALSYRVPRGQNIAVGRSQCPACKTILRPRDLVPVLSWLMTLGRCRMCGVKISVRYPAIEVLAAVVFVSAFAHEQRVAALALLLLAAVLMITLAIIDLEHRRLPFGLLALLAGALAFWRWLYGAEDMMFSLAVALGVSAAGVAIAAASRAWLGAPLMGAGDAYALAVGALALSWLSFAGFLGLAGALGLIFGALWRLKTKSWMFPFAPALFTALWLALLYGAALDDRALAGFVS